MELSCADWMERYAIHTGAFYSGEVIAAVSAILRPGDCLVDIGANIGFVTLCASSVVGAGGQVFALEPNTTLMARLNGMLVHNCISNVETLPFAAGDKTGYVGFSREPHHGNNHIIAERAGAPEVVPMRRVDDLLRDRLPIRKTVMVKIDVEGAELITLRGMPALIQRPATVFLIEVSDSRLRRNGSSWEELLDLMRSSGYSPFLPSFSPVSLDLRMQPLSKLTRPNKAYDVLFLRDSREAHL
jgi:FkbM family methyltransferase